MNRNRSNLISISLAMLSVTLLYAGDLSSYRGFKLGMNLVAAAKQADVKIAEAKVIYQRPAVIQELEWQPQGSSSPSAQGDPVRSVLFSFYNGELYRIVVSYDQDRTEGLTDGDLIESMSTKYGTPTTPVAKIISSSPSQAYSDSEKVLARWEDAENSFNLFRSSYGSAPGMLIFSKRLDTLAQAAIVQAIRLNEQEAPQREIDRLKKQNEDKNTAGEKVRPSNKAKFRP